MKLSHKTIIFLSIITALVTLVIYSWYKSWQAKFAPPRQGTPPIAFTIGKDFALDAVISDLYYYGFIKDENAFAYALAHSKDTTPGRQNALKIGSNTIDREARYTISQSMTAWEIANVLLNQGELATCDHGCPESNFDPELLPGGDLAPTIAEKYSWVQNYEDCVDSTGHDGGQLTSEENHLQTGLPRQCTAPDGRVFTEGQ
jgi:hypothetical protein